MKKQQDNRVKVFDEKITSKAPVTKRTNTRTALVSTIKNNIPIIKQNNKIASPKNAAKKHPLSPSITSNKPINSDKEKNDNENLEGKKLQFDEFDENRENQKNDTNSDSSNNSSKNSSKNS